MPRLRNLCAAAIALVGLCALAGCSATASPDSAVSSAGSSLAGQSITVYNAQHPELTQAWVDAFSRESGVKVTMRDGEDSELGNQLLQEGAASPADVFLTENSPGISLVDNAGLLEKLTPATLAQVPTAYRPSSGNWTGIAARSTVMVYNPSKISADQLPTSLSDLAAPAWKGRWAASPGGADFQAIVSAYLAEQGAAKTSAWLTAMKRNAVEYKGNSTVMKAVNAGEVPLGVIYHYYWFIDQAGTKENSGNTKLAYFGNQDPGAFVSISGGGVLKSSKHKAAAEAFLRFVTGRSGQSVLRDGSSFEYPVGSDATANPALTPLAELNAPTIDPGTLNSKQVTDLMTRAGII